MGLAVLGTTVLTTLGSSTGALGERLGVGLQALLLLASIAINAGAFTLASRIATGA